MPYYDPRLEVRRFAEVMEKELRENDHKGHWKDCTLGYLFKRLDEEVEELRSAVSEAHVNSFISDDGGVGVNGVPYDCMAVRKIRSEAADVANFCMMIVDICEKRCKQP